MGAKSNWVVVDCRVDTMLRELRIMGGEMAGVPGEISAMTLAVCTVGGLLVRGVVVTVT